MSGNGDSRNPDLPNYNPSFHGKVIRDIDSVKKDPTHQYFDPNAFLIQRCGGPVRVIAAILEPETAQQILNYLGLPSRPPPITPARYERRFHPDDFAS